MPEAEGDKCPTPRIWESVAKGRNDPSHSTRPGFGAGSPSSWYRIHAIHMKVFQMQIISNQALKLLLFISVISLPQMITLPIFCCGTLGTEAQGINIIILFFWTDSHRPGPHGNRQHVLFGTSLLCYLN